MGSYTLMPEMTLREVYLSWLIAVDNLQFLRENNLTAAQATMFKDYPNNTWGEFCDLVKQEQLTSPNTKRGSVNER